LKWFVRVNYFRALKNVHQECTHSWWSVGTRHLYGDPILQKSTLDFDNGQPCLYQQHLLWHTLWCALEVNLIAQVRQMCHLLVGQSTYESLKSILMEKSPFVHKYQMLTALLQHIVNYLSAFLSSIHPTYIKVNFLKIIIR